MKRLEVREGGKGIEIVEAWHLRWSRWEVRVKIGKFARLLGLFDQLLHFSFLCRSCLSQWKQSSIEKLVASLIEFSCRQALTSNTKALVLPMSSIGLKILFWLNCSDENSDVNKLGFGVIWERIWKRFNLEEFSEFFVLLFLSYLWGRTGLLLDRRWGLSYRFYSWVHKRRLGRW